MAEEVYKVIGGLEVAGTEPGKTITRKELEEYGAVVDPLVAGGHLELVKGGSQAKSETKKAGEA